MQEATVAKAEADEAKAAAAEAVQASRTSMRFGVRSKSASCL